MIRQLFTRGSRFMYVSMIILTLSGATLVATPGSASAQMTTDPTTDSRCRLEGRGFNCYELLRSSTEERPVRTSQTCNLGWSSRKATQDVTTTTIVQHDVTLVEEYIWVPDYVNGQHYWEMVWSYTDFDHWIVDTIVEVGECRPVTGKPPQN